MPASVSPPGKIPSHFLSRANKCKRHTSLLHGRRKRSPGPANEAFQAFCLACWQLGSSAMIVIATRPVRGLRCSNFKLLCVSICEPTVSQLRRAAANQNWHQWIKQGWHGSTNVDQEGLVATLRSSAVHWLVGQQAPTVHSIEKPESTAERMRRTRGSAHPARLDACCLVPAPLPRELGLPGLISCPDATNAKWVDLQWICHRSSGERSLIYEEASAASHPQKYHSQKWINHRAA